MDVQACSLRSLAYEDLSRTDSSLARCKDARRCCLRIDAPVRTFRSPIRAGLTAWRWRAGSGGSPSPRAGRSSSSWRASTVRPTAGRGGRSGSRRTPAGSLVRRPSNPGTRGPTAPCGSARRCGPARAASTWTSAGTRGSAIELDDARAVAAARVRRAGPAQAIPGLSQYWHPWLLHARVRGHAVVDGRGDRPRRGGRLRGEELVQRRLPRVVVVGAGPRLRRRRRLRGVRRRAGRASAPCG